MWEIITLQALAPAFVGKILQALFWIVPFCFGASIMYLLRFRKVNLRYFLEWGFILLGMLVATQNYEEKFFMCDKVVDNGKDYVYECFMRETVDSPWQGPVEFTDANKMIGEKYNRELYKGD